MKQLLILIAWMAISVNAHCDTLDFYHVYLNDSLIGQFNAMSENPSIALKHSTLHQDDVLTVRYGTDHPCYDCVHVLSVLLEVKEKTPEAKTAENFGKLSIPIKDLLYFRKKYEIGKFHFNYHTQTNTSRDSYGAYLFELRIVY